MSAPRQKTENLKKHITNEEKELRIKQEEILKQLPNDKIRPPTWLSKRSKSIFKQIVKELETTQLLANLDVHDLSVLSDAFDKYIEATIALNTGTLTVMETNKNGSTKEVPSPYIRIQNGYADIIKKYSVEFGLTPASRQRLIDINTELKDDDERDFKSKFGDV
ncbi:phage terminase small subunit P27 family [Clostridium felsineum]|uniref:phage terminase small subunit P27 family n=1 Tax=Clostridium felsineum TaxID=36839 RepID=UPI00214DB2C3|nr:phage terminase small subunit P27 family [Clostridium felsineum]MCR3758165.1 phage terminase small subunit P27 family [Clostridium felsineum]